MTFYRLSQQADLDLDRLYMFGFFTFGDQQADNYAVGLVKRLKDLAINPKQWPEVQEIRAGLHRSDYNVHSIDYRIELDDIFVVRILGHQHPHVLLEVECLAHY